MSTDPYFLSTGKHSTPADGRCAMEWVAHLAGEPHSDSPACVSPVLQRFCVAFNDRLPDSERQRLRPYLARTIGTAADGRDPERRRMCARWLLETVLPRLLSHDEVALAELSALPLELAVDNAGRLHVVLAASRDIAQRSRSREHERLTEAAGAAWAAGVVGAVGAVGVAGAVGAAEAAGIAEAAEAAGAAGAAWAAWAAFRARVRNVAQAHCRQLAGELNDSAFELLDRMLPMEILQLPAAPDAHAVGALQRAR